MQRWCRVVANGLLALAVAHALLWMYTQLRQPAPIAMAVPIAPARELRINIWKPVEDKTSFIFDGALAHAIDRPLTVIVWYHHTGAVQVTRLGSVEVPTWPLLVIAGVLGSSAVWLRRQTRF